MVVLPRTASFVSLLAVGSAIAMGAASACGLYEGGEGAAANDAAAADVTLRDAATLDVVTPTDAEEEADVVTDGDAGLDADTSIDADAAPAISIRINVNGPMHVGETLETAGTWQADPGADGGACEGASATAPAAIIGKDKALYVGEVYGDPVDCEIGTGLPKGDYDVTLYFAEFYYGPGCPRPDGGVGSRVFDIRVEAANVETNFDIFKHGGCVSNPDGGGKPVIRTYRQAVTKGSVTIRLTPSVEMAKISAIKVEGPL